MTGFGEKRSIKVLKPIFERDYENCFETDIKYDCEIFLTSKVELNDIFETSGKKDFHLKLSLFYSID